MVLLVFNAIFFGSKVWIVPFPLQAKWSPRSELNATIIPLIEDIVKAFGANFDPYLPDMVPKMLQVFVNDNSERKETTGKVRFIFEHLVGSVRDSWQYFDFFLWIIPAFERKKGSNRRNTLVCFVFENCPVEKFEVFIISFHQFSL